MKYKDGYKYQLSEAYTCLTPITPGRPISAPMIRLNTKGKLQVLSGYAWDGPSGPAIDTKNFMRGSLVHDALYQLMRMGKLDPYTEREKADQLLRDMCREDGMSWIRAWWVYKSLRMFGAKAAMRENRKPVLEAP